jgi:hypothetical protein
MPKANVTQATIERALKAGQAVGLPVTRYEVAPDGKIIVFTENGSGAPAGGNDWDKK